jgi:hypothetical protein
LEAVVAKLAKTADGVYITDPLRAKVYLSDWFESEMVDYDAEKGIWEAFSQLNLIMGTPGVPVSACYSTETAALASRTTEESKS